VNLLVNCFVCAGISLDLSRLEKRLARADGLIRARPPRLWNYSAAMIREKAPATTE
jgi:hypothetical protein